MNIDPNNEKHLKAVQADHDAILSVTESFFRFVGCAQSPDAAKEFHATQRLINEMLGEHFTYEESHLFPLLLAGKASKSATQIIANLCKEHASLLKQARLFSEMFAGGRNLDSHKDDLWAATTRFITALENHVADEEQLFALFDRVTRPASTTPR